MSIDKDAVLRALEGVADPAGGNLISSGTARAVTVEGDTVRFVLEIAADQASAYRAVQAQAEAAIRALDGVAHVSAVMTAHQDKAPPNLGQGGGRRPAPPPAQPVPGVARVIAIASGKGGVGKSTVASNLACALAAEGKRVGLLDADLYGPSQPRMLGQAGAPESTDGKTIDPPVAHGVKFISIGLMMPEAEAAIWRGPMLMSAIQQFLFQVNWGTLDVLIVDLPPGTGDVQITLAQKTMVAGAIVVSTPQDVALLDARKGINMFQKTNVPILGLVENMSTHICSNCGHEEHLFGHGGVAREAAAMGVPLLAEIPLHLDIRMAGDSGTPVVVARPDSHEAAAFRTLARDLIARGAV